MQKIVHFAGIRPWLSMLIPSADLWWNAAEKTFFSEDMKAELSYHPDKVKYWQEIEKIYYNTLQSTSWRLTTWLRFLFDTIKWFQILIKETLKH